MNAYPAVCQSLQVVFDQPATGIQNMARDESLLAGAVAGRGPTLRFYGWVEPTLSLGYFQPHEDRARHAGSRGCPVVRRPSGGGAIVHHRELTYCLAMPARQPLSGDAPQLYQVIHRALVATLDQFGLCARLRRGAGAEGNAVNDSGSRIRENSGSAANDPNSHEFGYGQNSVSSSQKNRSRRCPAGRREPFLCFRRQADGDVLFGNDKVAGSAQRRRRGAVLQHGSVLLGRCQAAPELPGIAELAGIDLDATQLARAWVERITAALAVALATPRPYRADESTVAKRLEKKYASASWTERR